MKVFLYVFLFALLGLTMAETPQEKLREYSDACKSESGVSEESLTKVRNGEKVDDPKLKEHGLCILKKAGIMNDKGELQIETIRTKFTSATNDAEKVEKLIKKCALQKSTPQDTASDFFECIYKLKQKAKAN